MTGATSISAVAQAPVPTEVRQEGAAALHGYRTALEFEGMLLKQMLSEALPESAAADGGEENGEEGGSFSYDPQVTTLPETISEEIIRAGGLGIAKDMYTSFEGGR